MSLRLPEQADSEHPTVPDRPCLAPATRLVGSALNGAAGTPSSSHPTLGDLVAELRAVRREVGDSAALTREAIGVLAETVPRR